MVCGGRTVSAVRFVGYVREFCFARTEKGGIGAGITYLREAICNGRPCRLDDRNACRSDACTAPFSPHSVDRKGKEPLAVTFPSVHRGSRLTKQCIW